MQSRTPRSAISNDPFQSAHARWLALTHRAPASHASFLYGVKSTKIYCRPTCSARLARRANVVFYDTEDQARRDGFRPCKRCKPDDLTFVGAGEEVATRVIKLLWVKKDDVTIKQGLKELAAEVGVTPSYLCRVFKKTMGMTVGAYRKELERETSEGDKETSVQCPSKVEPGPRHLGTGLLTPATTADGPSAPAEGRQGVPAEEDVGYVEEAVDLNFKSGFDSDFDFDEWLWADLYE